MNYKLSIVIPTKNRQQYCIAAIQQAIAVSNDLQIVIQDNSDDTSLGEFIQGLNKTNIVYNHHAGILSFVDNFSEAISLATGDYICVIGDDDCILPNIVDVVEYAEKNDYDSIIPGLNSVYFWPSDNAYIKKIEKGYLCLSYIKNKYVDVNVEKALHELMQRGAQEYQKLNIPRLYHGIVSRQAVRKVYELTGKYFDGLTPDIYMAVALSFVCKKVCRIFYPITVSGICPQSGSSDSATGKHTGKLNEAPHFKGHENYTWDCKIPAIYSVESIWAETVMHALHNFRREDLYKIFRVDILASICYKKYPQFSKEIYEHAKKWGISRHKLILLQFRLFLIPFIKKVLFRVIRKKNDVLKYYNILNIEEASNITMERVKHI